MVCSPGREAGEMLELDATQKHLLLAQYAIEQNLQRAGAAWVFEDVRVQYGGAIVERLSGQHFVRR